MPAAASERLVRPIALALAAALLLLNVCAVLAVLDRPLHYDENEYLHASWLMAAGERIYSDFFEDHPPHLFVLLHTVMPGGDLHAIDVLQWTRNGRLLGSLFGFAVVALVMLFSWRATRNAAAPVIAAAALLSSPQFWSRGLNDIRAEAPTLALFWGGLVLLTWSAEASRAQAVRAGLGIGLMFAAIVWNPKWPLEGALAGGYLLWYASRLWRANKRWGAMAVIAGGLTAAAAFIPIFTTTTLPDYLFFNFRLKAASVDAFANAQWVRDAFAREPVWASTSPQFRWYVVLPAMAVAAAALWRAGKLNRLAVIVLALNASALIEFRFLYPYPHLWAQYLVMIATASAVLYAMLVSAIRLERRPLVLLAGASMAVAVTTVAGPPLLRLAPASFPWWLCIAALAVAWLPLVFANVSLSAACAASAIALLSLGQIVAIGLRPNESWTFYWTRQADLQARSRGGTVFISPPRHPVAAFDAAYHWYSFKEAAPFAMQYAHSSLPKIEPSALPPCTIPPNLRFVEVAPWTFHLRDTCRCVESAFRDSRLKPTDSFAIFETNADPRTPLTPRAAQWSTRTANVWRDYCSYRGALDDEWEFEALAARK